MLPLALPLPVRWAWWAPVRSGTGAWAGRSRPLRVLGEQVAGLRRGAPRAVAEGAVGLPGGGPPAGRVARVAGGAEAAGQVLAVAALAVQRPGLLAQEGEEQRPVDPWRAVVVVRPGGLDEAVEVLAAR